ncbi:MAG: winged helix-turn-helix domain-containing protein [Methanomassiliicoccales archaeon]
MPTKEDAVSKEIFQLKQKVEEMGLELRYITTLLQGSQGPDLRQPELFELLREEARGKAESRLDAGMAKRCDMRPECRQRFMDLLDENLALLDRPRVTDEDLDMQTGKLESLRSHAAAGRCDGCFREVGSLFNDQTDLMRQLRLYRSKEEIRDSIDVMPEDVIVRDLLEPLSNPQRMVIMKALSRSQRSFTELSTITNLRGGNLLFHLQRLTGTGMVFQRGGRGDYALTPKGQRSLETVNDLYMRISESEREGTSAGASSDRPRPAARSN